LKDKEALIAVHVIRNRLLIFNKKIDDKNNCPILRGVEICW